MKKTIFVVILFFTSINLYSNDNIFDRIFFNDFLSAGKIIIDNPEFSFVFLTGVGAITATIINNDLIIKNYFNNSRTEFADKIFDIFNLTGDGITVLALNSFLFLFGKKERDTAEKVIEATATAGVTTFLLKLMTGRQRPCNTDDRYLFSPFSFNDSFPSGHTTVAFAWATVVAENYGIWYITYPIATMCGLARIYKNMHWASDVFIGFIIGTFFGKMVSLNQNSNIDILTKIDERTKTSLLLLSWKY